DREPVIRKILRAPSSSLVTPVLLGLLVALVPKLCLGTHFLETLFPVRGLLGKQSFPNTRSQTEFGNEGTRATRRTRGTRKMVKVARGFSFTVRVPRPSRTRRQSPYRCGRIRNGWRTPGGTKPLPGPRQQQSALTSACG